MMYENKKDKLAPGKIVLPKTTKVFDSVFALFNGSTLLSVFGILVAPVLHNLFHKFHLDANS